MDSSPLTSRSDGLPSYIPIVAFDANQPDITALVQERLGLPTDSQTFRGGVFKAVGLGDWTRLSTFSKVWAVAWRVVFLAAITFVGIQFLGPLAALFLVGMAVTFAGIGAFLQYQHNHRDTLDAAIKNLSESSMKVFQDRLWDRLEIHCLTPVIQSGVVCDRDREFAIKLSGINIEVFVMGVLQALQKSLAGNNQILPMAKMGMAYAVCEELWKRYQTQMHNYPWLENPEEDAPITEEQLMDASAKMVHQRMGINLALVKYWTYVCSTNGLTLGDITGVVNSLSSKGSQEGVATFFTNLQLSKLNRHAFPGRTPQMHRLNGLAAQCDSRAGVIERGGVISRGLGDDVNALIAQGYEPIEALREQSRRYKAELDQLEAAQQAAYRESEKRYEGVTYAHLPEVIRAGNLSAVRPKPFEDVQVEEV